MSFDRSWWTLPRRIIVSIVGGTVVLIGCALLVLPGPAFVVIPVGLGILGVEFVWARRWLRKLSRKVGVDLEKPVRRLANHFPENSDEERSRKAAIAAPKSVVYQEVRMTRETDPKGEGNRRADRHYRKAVRKTVEDTSPKERAEKARSISPEELEEARKAEEKAKQKARS